MRHAEHPTAHVRAVTVAPILPDHSVDQAGKRRVKDRYLTVNRSSIQLQICHPVLWRQRIRRTMASHLGLPAAFHHQRWRADFRCKNYPRQRAASSRGNRLVPNNGSSVGLPNSYEYQNHSPPPSGVIPWRRAIDQVLRTRSSIFCCLYWICFTTPVRQAMST